MKTKSFHTKWWKVIKFLLLLVLGVAFVWVVILLAEADNWLGISALATMILAIAAFVTIRNSNEQEKRVRKERLLNEIIDWATDILECGRVPDMLYEMRVRDKTTTDELKGVMSDDVRYRFNPIKARSVYLLKIAPTFGKRLQTFVNATTDAIEQQIELLKQTADGALSPDAVGDHRKVLDKSVDQLIAEATRLKTIDLGKKEGDMSKEDEATESNEITLKDIEEHLKQQDRRVKRATYFAGSVFGSSIILVAVSLWIGRTVLSTDAFYWTYIFLLVCGFGFMSWCWYKQRKIKG